MLMVMTQGIQEEEHRKEQEEKLKRKKEGVKDEDGLRRGENEMRCTKEKEKKRQEEEIKEEKEGRNKEIKICSFMPSPLLHCS
jgi:hypothetical protein